MARKLRRPLRQRLLTWAARRCGYLLVWSLGAPDATLIKIGRGRT